MPVILKDICEKVSLRVTISPLWKLPSSMLPAFCWSFCLNGHMEFSLLYFSPVAKFQVFHPPKEFLPG